MSDLISRSALIDDIRMIDTTHPFDDKEDILEKALSTIEFQPTVEAKPVVHGEWMEAIGENYWFDYTCSICGELEEFDYNFCPNCGADMRGGKNE